MRKLSVSHKHFSLRDVNITLEAGQILGLIGRSGSGKSTLMKALLGLHKKDSGSLQIRNGKEFFQVRNVLGYSPQDNALYPQLTIMENCLVFGKLRGLTSEEAKIRCQELISRLRLEGNETKRINELSGGMRKRADLTVALLHRPKILLLDEPFTGLDVSLRRFIWNLLQELAEQGTAIILSSHDLHEIEKHCDQFGLIINEEFYNTEQILKRLNGRKDLIEEYVTELFTQGAV